VGRPKEGAMTIKMLDRVEYNLDFEVLINSDIQLDDDEDEPKSLAQIFEEVGRVGFKAMAVLVVDRGQEDSFIIPVGTVVTVMEWDAATYPYSAISKFIYRSNYCAGFQTEKNVNVTLKRWLLVK
jgi:hypothetical protein